MLNLEELLDRVGGDHTLLQEIANIFLEECPGLIDSIRDAIRDGNAHQLERAAHSLKGSVSNFGAAEAVAAAYTLEALGRNNDLSPAPEALAKLEQEFQILIPELRALVAG